MSDYYFHHYAVHWGYAAIGEGMRSIPSVMSWDDHDIFDGWGSYPEELQNSTVFQVGFEMWVWGLVQQGLVLHGV